MSKDLEAVTTQPPITDAASAMKLVPREPTEAMLRAGAAMCDEPDDAEDRARALGVWIMMYDASQIAPAQADPGVEARELERDEALLGTRDRFIVSKGLWNEFVSQLPAALSRPAHGELVAALEPFATMGRMLDGPFAPALFQDDDPIGVGAAWKENGETRTITFGDLRRAARALGGGE